MKGIKGLFIAVVVLLSVVLAGCDDPTRNNCGSAFDGQATSWAYCTVTSK